MPLSSGTKFAGYTILRLLGSGGMGEVYLAEHPRLPRRDALKVLPDDISADPEYRERFTREADLAAGLWHPNIVAVHDRGEHEGQLWIAMDYVAGTNAADLRADRYPGGMPTEMVVEIVTAVAGALDYAHRQGLLHRDVKPANIMIAEPDDEGERRILLADFGIARNIGEISGLTATNMTVGTVAYSAPEQLMGLEIDGRADEYALATTAYHLLTGSQLFPNSNPAVVISRHLNAAPPRLADLRPELAALDPVLSVALSKDPEDRFARCQDFAKALAEQIGSGSQGLFASPTARAVPTPSRGGQPPKPRDKPAAAPAAADHSGKGRVRKWAIPAGVVATILLASAGTVAWWLLDHRSPGRTTTSGSTPPLSAAPAPTSSAPAAVPSAATPARPAVLPAPAIDTLVLSPAQITAIVAPHSGTLMSAKRSTSGMSENSRLVTPSACAGVIFGAEREVYARTGYLAMRDQALQKEDYSSQGPKEVEQTVVVFPTPEDAQAVLASSQSQWRACAKGHVSLSTVGQNGENGLTFDLGPVQLRNDVLTVSMVALNNESGGSACQQVLGVRANVVVGTRSCVYPDVPPSATSADPNLAGEDARNVANTILDNIRP